jgi:hypothetical protein
VGVGVDVRDPLCADTAWGAPRPRATRSEHIVRTGTSLFIITTSNCRRARKGLSLGRGAPPLTDPADPRGHQASAYCFIRAGGTREDREEHMPVPQPALLRIVACDARHSSVSGCYACQVALPPTGA